MVYMIGHKKGWFSAQKTVIDPNDPANTLDNSVPSVSDPKINNLCVSIHDTFENLWLINDQDLAVETMKPLTLLSDADLIAVANKYSVLYSPMSLRRQLAEEYLHNALTYTQAGTMRDNLVKRLTALSL